MTDAIEVRKIGYRQSAKDGLVITFAVHPNDMSPALAGAPIGTRYMAALVEIGDDEKPIEQPAKAVGKRKWGELTSAEQAGIVCEEPLFATYVKEISPGDGEPVDYLRRYCQVESRSELNTNEDAKARWQILQSKYRAWVLAG